MKDILDEIEKWLKDAPTQPHIEYMTSYCMEEEGKEAGLADIHPRAIEVWDKSAMMAEWDCFIRPRLEKKPDLKIVSD